MAQCQPPSGGCVLKPWLRIVQPVLLSQPPSGGCVLKPRNLLVRPWKDPAAFGRLCVETKCFLRKFVRRLQPPSGGCVLKQALTDCAVVCACQPPSGGCVLKRYSRNTVNQHDTPAAFGRLCVETLQAFVAPPECGPSRLRAAVC